MTPPRANSAAARDIANALHPYTDLKAHLETGPLVVTHGKGVRVLDENGKDYIEASPASGAPRSASTTSAWRRRPTTSSASCPSTIPSPPSRICR